MREIQIKVTVDWEDYDDVHPELVLEDAGIHGCLSDGVTYEVIRDNRFVKSGRDWVLRDTFDTKNNDQ